MVETTRTTLFSRERERLRIELEAKHSHFLTLINVFTSKSAGGLDKMRTF